MTIQVTSSAFAEGNRIPAKHSCDGKDVSPPLAWSGIPGGTQSIALICDDPDAPRGTWVHWVLYNLPADATGLPEGVPTMRMLDNGAAQGINSSREIGFSGPCPPPGPAHRYFFKIYALDVKLELKGEVTKAVLENAMRGHMLAEGQLMGRYGR